MQVEIDISYDSKTTKFGKVNEFEIDSNALDIDEVKVDIDNAPDIVENLINTFVTWFTGQLKSTFVPFIKEPVTKEINKLLAGKTIPDLTKLVG